MVNFEVSDKRFKIVITFFFRKKKYNTRFAIKMQKYWQKLNPSDKSTLYKAITDQRFLQSALLKRA